MNRILAAPPARIEIKARICPVKIINKNILVCAIVFCLQFVAASTKFLLAIITISDTDQQPAIIRIPGKNFCIIWCMTFLPEIQQQMQPEICPF